MKKSQLQRLIKEELQKVMLNEAGSEDVTVNVPLRFTSGHTQDGEYIIRLMIPNTPGASSPISNPLGAIDRLVQKNYSAIAFEIAKALHKELHHDKVKVELGKEVMTPAGEYKK